jgi:phosphoserine phosphatase RsbU/P
VFGSLTIYDLRGDLFLLIFGEVVFLAGVVACVLYGLRWRRSDRAELYMGLTALLYGARLIAEMDLLKKVTPGSPLDLIANVITLVIGIPFVLFLGCTLLPPRSWYVRIVVTAQCMLAVGGVITRIAAGDMRVVWFINGLIGITIAIAFPVIAVVSKAPRYTEMRVLRFGLVVFAAFVLNENMAAVGLPSVHRDLEPIGMIVYLGTLGYVGLARAIRTEQNWIAVRRELEIAREIQADLLPAAEFAQRPFRTYARYLPAATVAGDFYDLIPDGTRLGTLVADVSGHGIPAALSASMLKLALHTQREHMASPAKLLAGLNAVLSTSLKGQFITAAYTVVDSASQTLRYGGAGHPPIVVQRGNGRIEELEENGLFLGPFPAARYGELSIAFAPGDRCILYTDGFLEAANLKGEEFGSDRLRAILAAHASLATGQLCNLLIAQLAAWTGCPQGNPADDITLLIVEFSA